MKTIVRFTQFLRPDGERREMETDVDELRHARATALTAAGCWFEIEELSTGVVSMECRDAERILSGQMCPNGPTVPFAVEALIDTAFKRRFPW